MRYASFMRLEQLIFQLCKKGKNINWETVESGEASQLKFSAWSKIQAENLYSWSGKMAAVTYIIYRPTLTRSHSQSEASI